MKNTAACRVCGDVLVSRHRHDWVQCTCKRVFIDGGSDYVRRGLGPDVREGQVWYDLESDALLLADDGYNLFPEQWMLRVGPKRPGSSGPYRVFRQEDFLAARAFVGWL